MDRLESIMDAKSAPITGLPRGSEISDKTAKAAERYAKELEWHRQELAWIDEDLTALNKMERAITKAVDTLDPVQSAVIELRFKRLPTEKLTPFSKIAAAVNYSQSHVEKYERDAVDALCELIKIEDA